ncbi:MAG TPA: 4Fe-4S dicluster domain-containing protein [Methanothermococcus okinawensis]|uniref:4Fe-4S dicluster domain-containing protein n=1 Tax=Methanothermococcus okinawensis TaxID=155863 RepID=A0A833DRI9_9EURY|nr:4Fe-4S dicluster domain-containing protein [Methanothermococcus okinawensis]
MYEWKLNEIVDNDLCASCGTCAIVCPNNIVVFEDGPKLKEECLRKGHGMCYDICPRVSSGGYQIRIRGDFKEKEEYYYGKGDIEGQNGGVVSTFLKYLLENKKIDGAIVVGDECWKPVSLIIQNPEDIEKSAKSKYAISILDALRKAGEIGIERVAVVGLPCQISGLRKLQYFPYLAKYDGELGKNGKILKLPKIQYLIGLFCNKKFKQRSIEEILEKNNLNMEDIEKFDIKKDKFVITTYNNEKYSIPLEDIEYCEGCNVCRDFDAQMADISVGCAGSPENYSTVIIRTKKGEDIKNAIELKEGVNIEFIEKMRKLKMDRFKREIERRRNSGEKISYYWITDYGGVGKRADNTYFIRIRAKPGGWYSTEEINEIINTSKRYNGKIKITNRGAFEIHCIDPYYVEELVLELNKRNFITGSEGPLVRAILACPGGGNCSSGLIDTSELGVIIDERFKEYPAPYKFKIAISGCPNKCVRPQIHDIGIVGVKYPETNENCNGCGRCADVCKVEAIDVRGETSYTNYNSCIGCGKCIRACPNEGRDIKEEGYMIYVGGKSGREIIDGISMKLMDIEGIINLIDKVLKVYTKYAQKPQRERLGAVMHRIGTGKFLEEVKLLMDGDV